MSKAKKTMQKPALNATTAEQWLVEHAGFEDERTQHHKATVHSSTACEAFNTGEYGAIEITKMKRQPKLKIQAAPDQPFKATVYVSFDKHGWGLSVMPSTNTCPIEYASTLQIALHVAAVILEHAKARTEDFGMHLLDDTQSLIIVEVGQYD